MVKTGNNSFAVYKHALFVGLGAFFLAIGIGLGSQGLLKSISSLAIAFALLMLIILIGIIFDIIGTAAAAATEVPFHAKAARKVKGAKQAIALVKNADKVANFCNDVVGDVSASLSGAIGATIVSTLLTGNLENKLVIAGTVMTGFIAGTTVGGKALGKHFALAEANEIIFQVGRILAWLETTIGLKFFSATPKKGRKS
ncbi:hypothetical protein [Zhaonella formicivorans]|uniref:hypothetical protein n=1 Tax=Zhaonella formicivorans TaxID=2528593 RepID=UPI0010DCB99C|nr:hypothetical protein [Zhaonella formicivorans]